MKGLLLGLIVWTQLLISTESLEKEIETLRARWRVPGVAVAILEEGKVTFVEGFGFSDSARKAPVTVETVFPIGHCTKALTAFAVARLVERRRLDFDRELSYDVPSLRFADPELAKDMTVRDVLLERTGFSGHDLIWAGPDPLYPQEMLEKIRTLKPSYPLGERYSPSNITYVPLALAMERAAGMDWAGIMQEEVFDRIGMETTTLSRAGLPRGSVAIAYNRHHRGIGEGEANVSSVAPALGVLSTAKDLGAFLEVFLTGGEGVIDWNILAELWTGIVPYEGPKTQVKELTDLRQGLGWTLGKYRGHDAAYLQGRLEGYTATMMALPAKRVGIVVLANEEGYFPSLNFSDVVAFTLLDQLTNEAPIDWTERLKRRIRKYKEEKKIERLKRRKEKLMRERKKALRPTSNPLGDYAGDFEHPAYGVMEVHLNRYGRLQIHYKEMVFHLRHIDGNVFEGVLSGKNFWQPDLKRVKVNFELGFHDRIQELLIPINADQHLVSFMRKSFREVRPLEEPSSAAGGN